MGSKAKSPEVLILLGADFLISSTRALMEIGKGTTMPLMAAQRLGVDKQNTAFQRLLYLGVILLFLGISSMTGSINSPMMIVTVSTLMEN